MKRLRLLFMLCAALTSIASFAANVVVSHLTTENMTNPQGLGTTVPRFSWQLSSEKRQVVQSEKRRPTMDRLPRTRPAKWR